MRKCLPRRSFIGIVGGTIVIVGFIIIFSDLEELGRKLTTKSLSKNMPSSLLRSNTTVSKKILSSKTKHKSKLKLDISSSGRTASKNSRHTTNNSMSKFDWQTKTSPSTTKNDPQATKTSSSTNKNDPQATKKSPSTTKNDPQAKKTSPSTTKNDPQATKTSPSTNKNDPQTKITSPSTTKNDQQTAKTLPSTTKNDQQTAKKSPSTTKIDQQTAKTSPSSTKRDQQTAKTSPSTTKRDQQTAKTSPSTTKRDQQTAKTSPSTTKSDQETAKTSPSTTKNYLSSTKASTSTAKNDQRKIDEQKSSSQVKKNLTLTSNQTYHMNTKNLVEQSFKNVKENKSGQQQPKTKIILLWRELYKTVKAIQGHFTQVCPSCNCTVTNDRKMLTKADAVLFEVEGMYQLPMKPKTGQVWVYVEMESPTYMPNGVAKWDNLFNWTMTYRRDSDIQTFYGSVWPKEQKNHEKMEDFSKNKTGRMLWMVGHCKTPSKRENYIKELQQFMDVDTIGRCGKRVCGREKPCENEMLRQYKYYFAAENSDCRDYITEKAFRTVLFPILPAVKGGSNYSLYLPPKSYIDVNTFNKAESFAKYIKTMDENKDKYNEIFSWKNEYRGQYGVPDRLDPFCKLCERLHKENKYRRLYRSIRDWWRGNAKTTGDYFCPVNQLAKL